MNTSNREADGNNEKIFNAWMFEHFMQCVGKYRQSTDEENINGTDAYLSFDTWHNIPVDIKVQITKTGQLITYKDTQCLELMHLCRPDYTRWMSGWWKAHTTPWYLFTQITDYNGDFNYKDKSNPLKHENINKVRAIMISRNRIQMMHMLEYGVFSNDIDNAMKEALRFNFTRKYKDTKTGKEIGYVDIIPDKLWLSRSLYLPESTINLIIKWNMFEQYAQYVFDIDKRSVKVCRTLKTLQNMSQQIKTY